MKASAGDDEVQGGAGTAEADRPTLEPGFPISGFIVLGKLFSLSEFLLCLLEFIIKMKWNMEIVCKL